MSRGARNQMTARAGECYVAAELNKRGAYAVTFAGNMPEIDVLASDEARQRTVKIQVKSKRSGTWHSSIDKFLDGEEDKDAFWIFVDIGQPGEPPEFWIVPWNWLLKKQRDVIKSYFKVHGGSRPKNPESKHHGIGEKDIAQWRNRWDVLGIL